MTQGLWHAEMPNQMTLNFKNLKHPGIPQGLWHAEMPDQMTLIF